MQAGTPTFREVEWQVCAQVTRLPEGRPAWLQAAELPSGRSSGGCWLDGPERWLEPILADRSDVALLLDTDGALRGLPWELLHAKTFLCAHPHRLVTPVRRISGAGKRTPPDACNRPLRVLFMASSPEAVQPVLDFEQEEARILEATKAQPIELLVEESGTLRGLEERLRDFGAGHFDVVHLSGHAGRVTVRRSTNDLSPTSRAHPPPRRGY